VESGDVVIDVGGHLGTFTRFALDHGARQVVGLEPEPRNVACFRRTFDREIRVPGG
jgi:FkbM family methyltransferase